MEIDTGYQIVDAGFVQTREWMLYKIREDHYPMNLMLDFDLDMFDPNLFQETINLLVAKHEILRTSLRVIGGVLKQIIHNPGTLGIKFDFFDISAMESSAKNRLLQHKRLLLSQTPFNFEYGPLFRVAVFKKKPNQFEIVWIFHHVIFDSYSAGIFEADAIQAWNHLVQGMKAVFCTEPVAYQKYTAFENLLLNTQLGDNYKEFWRIQLLKGFPRLLIINQDAWDSYSKQLLEKVEVVRKRVFELLFSDQRFIASVVRRYKYNRAGGIDYYYSINTFKQILEFKRNNNSSLLALFIAGLLLALNKLSGQDIFIFDIPASRKSDGIYKEMIGWLVAGGICYFDVSKCDNTVTFLNYIDTQLYHLARHCIYPFEVLDYDSEIPIGSTMPTFLTLTEFGYNKDKKPESSGIINHEYEGPACCQDMDIYLAVYADCCSMRIVYNNSLLFPEIVEKLVLEQECCLNNLLQDCLERPNI